MPVLIDHVATNLKPMQKNTGQSFFYCLVVDIQYHGNDVKRPKITFVSRRRVLFKHILNCIVLVIKQLYHASFVGIVKKCCQSAPRTARSVLPSVLKASSTSGPDSSFDYSLKQV